MTVRLELKQVQIKHGKDQFLVLTSDVIHLVMQDQVVVDCKCEDSKEGVARLADKAHLFSCEDNATALVVPFGSWDKGNSSNIAAYSTASAGKLECICC